MVVPRQSRGPIATARAIKQVGLWDLRERPVGRLSGGQRQRVLVARALAREPKLLLLDEPFTGLDIPTTEQLLYLFRELVDSGVAVVMSTHNARAVNDMRKRVIELHLGKLVRDDHHGVYSVHGS